MLTVEFTWLMERHQNKVCFRNQGKDLKTKKQKLIKEK
jgi:hypothetical protein